MFIRFTLLACLCWFSGIIAQLSEESKESNSGQPLIPSPLLDETTAVGYAQLNSLVYKSSLQLYPVRILSINEYLIKPLLHGYEYPIAPDTYILEVRPDFSLLSDIKPFMNASFTIKRIEITVSANKRYGIGARIDIDDPANWQVQLFDIQTSSATE